MMNEGYYRPMGFRVLPPVVKNLLIINGLFFLATLALQPAIGLDLIDRLGLRFVLAERFNPYQFITYMFLHAGWAHLLFNMFALWMFGYMLENIWGAKRFLIYYFATGVGAAIIHYITVYFTLRPDLELMNAFLEYPELARLEYLVSQHKFRVNEYSGEMWSLFNAFGASLRSLQLDPTNHIAMQESINFVSSYKEYFLNQPNVVGASGAVFGILLAFGMTFPNSIIYLYFAIPIKAKYFVIIYGLIELYLGFSRTGGNVAHFAHLGGMVFGYLLLMYWRYLDKPKFR